MAITYGRPMRRSNRKKFMTPNATTKETTTSPALYTVVTGKTATELGTNVGSFLNDGWTLQGGVNVSIDFTGGQALFAQALYK